MTIKKEYWWGIYCDRCGQGFSMSDLDVELTKTKKEAIENLKDSEYDWEIHGNKVYCDVCCEKLYEESFEKKRNPKEV